MNVEANNRIRFGVEVYGFDVIAPDHIIIKFITKGGEVVDMELYTYKREYFAETREIAKTLMNFQKKYKEYFGAQEREYVYDEGDFREILERA